MLALHCLLPMAGAGVPHRRRDQSFRWLHANERAWFLFSNLRACGM